MAAGLIILLIESLDMSRIFVERAKCLRPATAPGSLAELHRLGTGEESIHIGLQRGPARRRADCEGKMRLRKFIAKLHADRRPFEDFGVVADEPGAVISSKARNLFNSARWFICLVCGPERRASNRQSAKRRNWPPSATASTTARRRRRALKTAREKALGSSA